MWSSVADLYRSWIYDAGKQPLFLLLVSFIVGFLFIRASTRMIRAQVRWWPGNVTPGGLHIHHVVFGVVLMLACGVGSFTATGGGHPWADIFAAAFGVGAAPVLDEFALILHLEDVYWTEQGRTSVDAVILAVALTGLVMLGASPFGVEQSARAETAGWQVALAAAENVVLVVITFLRGKMWTGAIGIVLPFVALVGALRLARPESPWARARYTPGSRKDLKSRDRDKRIEDRWRRRLRSAGDAVAGRPDQPAAP